MPKIICHMIASVDGRLVVSRWSRPQEPVDISETYEGAASRYAADGWIVGRTTMADYADSVVEHAPAAVRTSCGESLITIGAVPIAEAPMIGDPVKVTVEIEEGRA